MNHLVKALQKLNSKLDKQHTTIILKNVVPLIKSWTLYKTMDIAEKYDTKVLGREKYQKEHQYEKW